MRMNFEPVRPKLKKQIIRDFASILADMKDPKEVQFFLNDFFNDQERLIFAKRLAIADWLARGKGYILTKLNIKVSSATVAAVNKKLKRPGYQFALKKLAERRERKEQEIVV